MGCEVDYPKCPVSERIIVDTPGVCIDIMMGRSGFEQGEITNMFIVRRFNRVVECIMLVVKD
jgi:hypothetical protein